MVSKLATRKPDLLDELDAIRYRRRIAYEERRQGDVRKCNLEIKKIRLQNDWSEEDAQVEFRENQKHFKKPFRERSSRLTFDVLDNNGQPANIQLSINQLSKYNFLRGLGFTYEEALKNCR